MQAMREGGLVSESEQLMCAWLSLTEHGHLDFVAASIQRILPENRCPDPALRIAANVPRTHVAIRSPSHSLSAERSIEETRGGS